MTNFKDLYEALEGGNLVKLESQLKDKDSKLSFLKYNEESDNNNTPLHIIFEDPSKKIIEFFKGSLDKESLKSALGVLNNGGYNPLGKIMSSDDPKVALETILSSFDSKEERAEILLSFDEDQENILHWLAGEDEEDLDQDLLNYVLESAKENDCFDSMISQQRVSGDSPLHFAMDNKANIVLERIVDEAKESDSLDALFTAKGENNNVILHSINDLSEDVRNKLFTLLPSDKSADYLSQENNGELKAIEKIFYGGDFTSLVSVLSDENKMVVTKSILDNIVNEDFVSDLEEDTEEYLEKLSAFYNAIESDQKKLVLDQVDLTKRDSINSVFSEAIISEKESIEKAALLEKAVSPKSLVDAKEEANEKSLNVDSEVAAKLAEMKSAAIDAVKNADESGFSDAVETSLADAEVLEALEEGIIAEVKAEITSSVEKFIGEIPSDSDKEALEAYIAKVKSYEESHSNYVSSEISENKDSAQNLVAKIYLVDSIKDAESLVKASQEAGAKSLDISSEVATKLAEMKSAAIDAVKNADESGFADAVKTSLADAKILEALEEGIAAEVKSEITSSVDKFIGEMPSESDKEALEAYIAKVKSYEESHSDYVSSEISENKDSAQNLVARIEILDSIKDAKSLVKASQEAEAKSIDIDSEVATKLAEMKSDAIDAVKNADESGFADTVETSLANAKVLEALEKGIAAEVKSEITSSIDRFFKDVTFSDVDKAEKVVSKIQYFNKFYSDLISNETLGVKERADQYIEKNSFSQDELEKTVKAQFLSEKYKSIISKVQDADNSDLAAAVEICKEMKVKSQISQDDITVTYKKVLSADSLGKFFGKCSGEKRVNTFFEKSLAAISKMEKNAQDADSLAKEFARCDSDGCVSEFIEQKGLCNQDSGLLADTSDCQYLVGADNSVDSV